MKKYLFLSAAFALSSFAAEWVGFISDASCGAGNAKPTAEAKECAQRCVKSGAAPVFVTGDGKVLTIVDPKKVMDFVGDKVKVKGSLSKDKLTVETIAKAS
ncbi:MAG: hypothetical protein K2X03_00135 [Bryobacteraceae bacterium]|nr:hypothetical protein [Bryobacteraceae bacterium]